MIGDLFHYGHLNLLKQANEVADYHITGVITDKIAEEWQAIKRENLPMGSLEIKGGTPCFSLYLYVAMDNP